ncbi:MAG: hypothetical protein K8S99_15820 [Planctomycetes bacterium]|nr:hypothetical protein [Planctomycetota bacterium]
MKLSRERKVFLGILGLGLTALAADRFVISPTGPRSAQASIASVVQDSATQAQPVPAAPEAATAPIAPANTVRVAHQLESFGQEQGLRADETANAFQPSAAWLAEDEASAPKPQSLAPVGPPPAQAFTAAHKLNGVMAKGGGGYAIINGRAVTVGQTVDGFRLVEVSRRSAVFQSSTGEQAELTLQTPAGSAANPRS